MIHNERTDSEDKILLARKGFGTYSRLGYGEHMRGSKALTS